MFVDNPTNIPETFLGITGIRDLGLQPQTCIIIGFGFVQMVNFSLEGVSVPSLTFSLTGVSARLDGRPIRRAALQATRKCRDRECCGVAGRMYYQG